MAAGSETAAQLGGLLRPQQYASRSVHDLSGVWDFQLDPEGEGEAYGWMAELPATSDDFFPYSGLHRSVVLFAVPKAAHIDDVTVVTTIDGSDGVVEVTVATGDDYAGTGRARIGDIATDLSFDGGEATATLRMPDAQLWGSGHPHLYPLTVELTGDDGVIDTYALDIGIRTVAVEGDRILLNGEAVELIGFGKHEDLPLSGRGLNLPQVVRDYELMRWIGANSCRTAHYLYAEEAMDLADRLGVLVINETPAVGLNFNDPAEMSAVRQEQCKRYLRELIVRDRNHPSTIMWSVANEPFGGSRYRGSGFRLRRGRSKPARGRSRSFMTWRARSTARGR